MSDTAYTKLKTLLEHDLPQAIDAYEAERSAEVGSADRTRDAERKAALKLGAKRPPKVATSGEPSAKLAVATLRETASTLPAQLDLTNKVYDKKLEEMTNDRLYWEAQIQTLTAPSYNIGTGQDPAQALTGDALKNYLGTLEWLDGLKRGVWRILSGQEAVRKGYAPQIHSKSFRHIETYVVALEMLVLKHHSAPALAELAEVALAIVAGAVDRYQPKPIVKGGKLFSLEIGEIKPVFGKTAVKEQSHDLEQVGLRRFCNLWEHNGSSEFDDVGTDTDELELDLYFETIAELLHVLVKNEGFSARVDEAALALDDLYWNHLRPRRKHLSNKAYPGKLDDVYGKDLLHPVFNKYLEHEHAYAVKGLPEDRAAADRMRGYLEEHLEYITAPDGTETVVGGHRIVGRGRELGLAYGVTTLHNSVYLHEWVPNALVGNWLGFSLCSDRLLDALAQTLYWHIMVEGTAKPFAANMGGGLAARQPY